MMFILDKIPFGEYNFVIARNATLDNTETLKILGSN